MKKRTPIHGADAAIEAQLKAIRPLRSVKTPKSLQGRVDVGLRCPRCTCADFAVRWTIPSAKGLSRGRTCLACGWAGTTIETFTGEWAKATKRKSGKRPPTA